ncbi:MAG: glycine oxidase ThiO [Halothiobacillus sp.]
MSHTDCIIIGSGIAGLTTALKVREAGLSVTVLERTQLGREASWAGGGILCPLYAWRYPEPVMRLAAAGMARYPAFIEELRSKQTTDPEFYTSGMLVVDPIQTPNEAERIAAWATRHQYPHQWQAASAHFAHLPDQNALWLPDINTVRNPRLLHALIAAVRQAGVILLEQQPALELLVQNNRITGVRCDRATYPAGQVIVTAGAWSGGLVPGLSPAHIFPVRGQMIRFEPAPAPGLHTILMDQGIYMIPRQDGSVVVGSTVEHVGFDKHTTTEAIAHLHRRAVALWPNLARNAIAQQWAGLRPGSQDEIPYLGAHPKIEGLWVGAGFYRNGLAMGPMVAEILTHLITGQPAIMDLTDYRLDRPTQF